MCAHIVFSPYIEEWNSAIGCNKPGGGGELYQIFSSQVQHAIKFDPIGSTICKNEGSKRSKTNEKGGQLDKKTSRKFIKKALELLNNTFW